MRKHNPSLVGLIFVGLAIWLVAGIAGAVSYSTIIQRVYYMGSDPGAGAMPVSGTLTMGGVSKGAGATDSTTLRAVAATDSPEVTSLASLVATISGGRLLVADNTSRDAGATSSLTPRTVTATDSPDVTALATANGTLTTSGATLAAISGKITTTNTELGTLNTGVKQGGPATAANAWPMGQVIPTTGAPVAFVPNQVEVAPDIAADATGKRQEIVCHNAGTTPVCVSEAVNSAGGTLCFPYGGGYVLNDTTGSWFKITGSSAVYFWDTAGLGIGRVICNTNVNP
jgi:hypothetical protein